MPDRKKIRLTATYAEFYALNSANYKKFYGIFSVEASARTGLAELGACR
jgi:hypothetical protein